MFEIQRKLCTTPWKDACLCCYFVVATHQLFKIRYDKYSLFDFCIWQFRKQLDCEYWKTRPSRLSTLTKFLIRSSLMWGGYRHFILYHQNLADFCAALCVFYDSIAIIKGNGQLSPYFTSSSKWNLLNPIQFFHMWIMLISLSLICS